MIEVVGLSVAGLATVSWALACYFICRLAIHSAEDTIRAIQTQLQESQRLINNLSDKLMSRNYESYASVQMAMNEPPAVPKPFTDTEGEYVSEVEEK